jgi:hypothetical protein
MVKHIVRHSRQYAENGSVATGVLHTYPTDTVTPSVCIVVELVLEYMHYAILVNDNRIPVCLMITTASP